jgi:hypothetical protein
LSIGLGADSYAENKAEGDRLGMYIDGAGIGLDSVALVLPLIPGGFGAAKFGVTKGGKLLSKGVDGLQSSFLAWKKARAFNAELKAFAKTGFQRRSWTSGKAGDSFKNLGEHVLKHKDEVGATSVNDYYTKANDFIDNKNYTHSFKEGGDVVYFNRDTKYSAVTDSEGNLRTYLVEGNQNKIQNYEARIKKGNYGN